MMSTLQQIRAALSGADEEATQPLGRWTPLPRPMLKLITHASIRARLAVLGALAAVVVLPLYAPGPQGGQPGAGAATPPAPIPPAGGSGGVAAAPTPPHAAPRCLAGSGAPASARADPGASDA